MALLFPAFFDHPKEIFFSQQEADESIEIFLRSHRVTNLPWITIFLLGYLLPVFIPFFRLPTLIEVSVPAEIFSAGLIIWYLLVIAFGVEQFLHWYFNVYIVTNKHILQIGFENILNTSRIEARLDDIQSISIQKVGVIRPLFNFGDVMIQTAADKQNVVFKNIPHPDIVADRIQDLQEIQEGPKDLT